MMNISINDNIINFLTDCIKLGRLVSMFDVDKYNISMDVWRRIAELTDEDIINGAIQILSRIPGARAREIV